MLRAAVNDAPGAPGRLIPWDEAKLLVKDGCAGMLWVDAVVPTPDELIELEQVFHLHALTVEDLVHRNQRAKVEEFPNYLFVVMHWFPPTQTHEKDDPDELHCVLGTHFLLTVSDPCALPPVETAWSRFLSGTGARGPVGAEAALYRVLDELVDAHRPRLDALDDEIDALGVRVNKLESTTQLISDLHAVRHRVVVFRRLIANERDVMQALARRDYQLLNEKTSVYFRDIADHLTRTYESIEALREHVDLTTQEHFAFVENQRSGVIKRLTIISTIFLPLNFITGFFGMNFTHLPFDSWEMLIVGLSAMALVPSGFMAWLLLKRWV